MTQTEKTWEAWREHVLAEIKRSNDNIVVITGALNAIQVEIARLQVKSGIWGVIGGLIPVLIVILVEKFK